MQYLNLTLNQYGTNNSPQRPISCGIRREQNNLKVWFHLRDFVSKVKIPEQKSILPKRQDDLWQNTCFELFLTSTGLKKYWEINLSPNKNWNVYGFDTYRNGMKRENKIGSIHILTHKEKNSFSLYTCLPLDKISLGNFPLQIGISAVLEMVDEPKTYWALKHGQERPDFHDRSSFILTL